MIEKNRWAVLLKNVLLIVLINCFGYLEAYAAPIQSGETSVLPLIPRSSQQ